MILHILDMVTITNKLAEDMKAKGYFKEIAQMAQVGYPAILNQGGLFGKLYLAAKNTHPFIVSGTLQYLATELQLYEVTDMKKKPLYQPIGEPIIVLNSLAEGIKTKPSFHLDLDEDN